MRINKVKVNGEGEIVIDWQDNETDVDGRFPSYTVKNPVKAKASFYTAIKNCREIVLEVCEFSKPELESIEVKGITVKYKNDNVMAMVTAMKHLNKTATPYLINTPIKYLHGDVDDAVKMSQNGVQLIEKVIKRATEYLKGIKAQITIFDKEDDSTERSSIYKNDEE